MTHIAAVRCAFPPHRYPQAELTDMAARVCLPADADRRLLDRLHRSARVEYRNLALPIEEYEKLDGFGAANDAYVTAAVELGLECVGAALADAGLAPADVDMIMFTSVTGIAVPSIDARVAGALGLRQDVKRLPIFGLGCVAGAAGIARLHDYLRGWPDHVAVLLSVELCSLTVQRGDSSPAGLVASALFGDGAAAVVACGSARDTPARPHRGTRGNMAVPPHRGIPGDVTVPPHRDTPRDVTVAAPRDTAGDKAGGTGGVATAASGSTGAAGGVSGTAGGTIRVAGSTTDAATATSGITGTTDAATATSGITGTTDAATAMSSITGGPGTGRGPVVVATRSRLYPGSGHVMGWQVGGGGLRVVLDAGVPDVVRRYLADDVHAFLADHGVTAGEVSAWVCHPGGPKVLEAVAEALKLPPGALDVTWRSLAANGNLSSSSVLHVLSETLATRRPEPGTWGMLVAMGPGFCSELVLLRW